jgi:hypothetical protein
LASSRVAVASNTIKPSWLPEGGGGALLPAISVVCVCRLVCKLSFLLILQRHVYLLESFLLAIGIDWTSNGSKHNTHVLVYTTTQGIINTHVLVYTTTQGIINTCAQPCAHTGGLHETQCTSRFLRPYT